MCFNNHELLFVNLAATPLFYVFGIGVYWFTYIYLLYSCMIVIIAL